MTASPTLQEPTGDAAPSEVAAREVDVVVIGAGQAGLSAAYFLRARGTGGDDGFVVLDANEGPGGAWQHRWDTLTNDHVHGFHPLPGTDEVGGGAGEAANEAVPRYFADYEERFGLPVVRPVRVREVRDREDGRLAVHTAVGTWIARVVINATGTWTRPFWPRYPGMTEFRGRQLHTAEYAGPHEFRGLRVLVVGGGHSAIQHLAEISEVASTTWVTRRPPEWRDEQFTPDRGRAAVARVAEAVEAGRRPESVVSVTGLHAGPLVAAARDRGVYERLPMFSRLTPTGAVWDDGHAVDVDVILWATGFRHALDHLAPLGLRHRAGGIRMRGTQVAEDPRIHLLGYGPSASTIGANRAGRSAARDVRRHLAAERDRS